MIYRFTFLFVHFWLVDLKQCFAFSMVIYFLKLTRLGMFWQVNVCVCFVVLTRVLVLFAFGNVPLFYFWQCSVVLFPLTHNQPPPLPLLPAIKVLARVQITAPTKYLQQGATVGNHQMICIWQKKNLEVVHWYNGWASDRPSEKWGAIREWSRSQCFR